MVHLFEPGSIRNRAGQPLCSKCDAPLFDLTDGTLRTVDIAHQRESVAQAVAKLHEALEGCWQFSYAAELRLIVGGGLIREAVLGELHFLASTGVILAYQEENRGAVLLKVRN